jgi:hypothetical protein
MSPNVTQRSLVAQLQAFQFGVAGDQTLNPKALPAAKHAFDYDLEDWGGFNWASFNAIVSDRDQVE